MSTNHAALDVESAAIAGSSGHDSLAPTPATHAVSSPVPWRSASLTSRNSPAPVHSSTFRDAGDHSPVSHSGMTPVRTTSSGASSSDRQRLQPFASGPSSTGSSNPGGPGQNSSKRPTASATNSYTADRGNGGEHPPAAMASPTFGPFNSFSRSSPTSGFSSSCSSTAPSAPAAVAGTNLSSELGAGAGTSTMSSTTTSQKQPLNMEALAAKFADPKENKERFAKLQLSPALAPAGLPEKERRTPMGSFVAPSPVSSHMAHIKVQRTTSLNQSSYSSSQLKGSGSRLQPGHLVQTTDMRRTASHNNAFSSALGNPLGSSSGALDHSGLGHANSTVTSTAGIASSNHSNGATGHGHGTLGGILGNSPQFAPFSLRPMTYSPRRSSLTPPDYATTNQQDHVSPVQTPLPSPLTGDKHPLQHSWTLYYDITSGYNRQGSSHHNYENGLKGLGSFSTVELFARYFNWIEKPHKMENSANYHLFKNGIKPMWEDPANVNGGRWTVTFLQKNPELLDRCWMELAYALVGEQLDAGDDICGAVLSRRTKADRLAVWVRDKENVDAINGIGKRLIKILDLAKQMITLEFQITTDPRSSGLSNLITLEIIKEDLDREAPPTIMTLSSSDTDSTPTLSADSVSATPTSLSAPSPATPSSNGFENGFAIKDNPLVTGAAGLLISVDGKESHFNV